MGDDPVAEREVASIHRFVAYGVHEGLAAFIGLGCEHEAGRVVIEAMHDPQPVVLPLHVAEVGCAAMKDQSVHQRAVAMVDRRVAHQTSLFGKDNQILVLVADVQVDRLSGNARRRIVRDLVDDRIACADTMLLAGRSTVDKDQPLFSGAGSSGAAGIAAMRRQNRIQTPPIVGGNRNMA